MKKPDNWKELDTVELQYWIDKLNVWNCEQQISHSEHIQHYQKEIDPLVKLKEQKVKAWLDRMEAEHV